MAVPDTSYNYSFVMKIGSTPIMDHGQEHSLCVPIMVSSMVRHPTIYYSWTCLDGCGSKKYFIFDRKTTFWVD